MPRFIVDEKDQRTVLEIDKEKILVGRSQENDISLIDLRASRLHCRMERHGAQFLVVDLGSQNGTRLNGHLVDRSALKVGDEIGVGNARIWFEKAPPPDAVDTHDTMVGNLRELAGGSGRDRLDRLIRIVKAVNSELHLDPLLKIIIDHLVEITQAERGFLVLLGGEGRSAARVARNFEQEDVADPEVAFSQTIVAKVMESGEPVVTANAVEDDRFSDTLSVNAIRVRSVMCLPFKMRGKSVGAIYVDNRLQKGAFGDAELETLTTLADLAATAIERARLYDENIDQAAQLEDLNQRLELRVEHQARELTEVRDRLRTAGESEGVYPEIVGQSPVMRDMFKLLDKIVQTEEPVLITGESGTGKELIAKAIHAKGPRARRPFLSENCAALPESLLESELFGHVRGSFTGADRDKKGLFELAHTGTLFLDEVGDMSPEMQKKLLRTLQEGEVRPVGAKAVRKVDVRIVSASNKKLEALVRAGEFREDLYYRLRVLNIDLPPLRDRKGDVPLLLEHFLNLHALEGRGNKRMADGVVEVLLAHEWRGNIRELENEVKRMVALSDDVIEVGVLSEAVRRGGGAFEAEDDGAVRNLVELVEGVERREIEKALAASQGNKTRAADLLGISRFTLQRKLDKYDIST